VALFPGTVSAQCLGDLNGDGAVVINELVRTVTNAVVGCAEAAPTACPTDFTQPGSCTFSGFFGDSRTNFNCLRYDDRRPFMVQVVSDGERVTLVLMGDPLWLMHADVTSPTGAELTDWSYTGNADMHPTNGLVQLVNERRRLVIPPDPTRTFALFGCAFDWTIEATAVTP